MGRLLPRDSDGKRHAICGRFEVCGHYSASWKLPVYARALVCIVGFCEWFQEGTHGLYYLLPPAHQPTGVSCVALHEVGPSKKIEIGIRHGKAVSPQ